MTCANQTTTPNLEFVYSYVIPPSLRGTIVLFSGDGGVLGDVKQSQLYAADYYNLGYEIVEVAWSTDWEQTSDNLGILTAGCRPAGFLNYVLNTPILNARSVKSTNGLCAQGASAGAGALGYVFVWYADHSGNLLSTDLDNVELLSGPVFGNIALGCQVPPPQNPANICLSQYGCSNGTTAWTDAYQYVIPATNEVPYWTNNPSCAGSSNTTSNSFSKWLAMSIVTGSGGSFSYPNMGMAGWLCAGYLSCNANEGCPNNSAAEGNVFFSQITSGSQAAGYKLTGILGCDGAEKLANGYDPDNSCTPPPNGTCKYGYQAVEAHMQTQCVHPSPH
jgi:hypothetical protein